MTKLKELFSDTLIYGISSVGARFIGYLLVPLHTGVFETEQYGVVSLVFSAIVLFNVLFTMGMESAYIRYAKNRDKAKSYFKTLQLFLLGTSALFAIILWFAEPLISPLMGLESSDPIFWMMLGILFFDTLGIVPFAELRLVRRSTSFVVIKTMNVLINLGLNFYLILGLNYGIEAVFISNFAASLITAIAIWIVTMPMLFGEWDKEFLKKALIFGLPFIPAGFGHAINEAMDRFFLKAMNPESVNTLYGSETTAEDVVGIYSACYKLAVFMLLLVQMFRMAWQPFFMRESESETAPDTFAKSFSLFNLGAAAIFLSVALFTEQIVSIRIPLLDKYIVGEDYWAGLSVVPVLLIAYWFQGWYINFSAGIFISETTKRLAQITLIGAAVTIVGNLAMIPFLGMMGSAFATLLSYGVMAMIIYYYSTRSFTVPYNLVQGFGVMILSAAAVLLQPVLVGLGWNEMFASFLLLISSLSAIGIWTLKYVRK